MGMIMQCFSIEQLEQLDDRQVALLRSAIEREIGNNPEILRILRERFQPMYDRMTSQRPAQRARRPRSPRTPQPGT
jgi:hypothetical protein